MSTRSRLLLLATAAALFAPGPRPAVAAPKPPLCTAGRFAVQGSPLLGPGGEVVVLENRTLAVGTLCAARKAKLRATRKGTRGKVVFRKRGCTGVQGKVRLSALITVSCSMMDGTLKAPKTPPVDFHAATSACGDGVVDAGNGEACDGAAGCAAQESCTPGCTCARTLARPSKSGTIAITDDDALVVMVNPDDDSISIFRTADDTRLSKVTTGDEPSAVVLSADGKTAWVANRAAATVVKVSGIDTASPTVSDPIDVGSEPTGLALTPTGAHLFVAEFAEGRVSRIDTAAMTVTGTIDSPQNPRGIGVTNDGDADDADEHVVVPEFFGEPNANGEGKDTGRTGRVRIYKVSDLSPEPPITFDPIDSGVAKGGNPANGTVMTSPNQLWGVAFRDDRIYLPSVSASPEGPPRFDNNVFAVVWVGDLTGRQPVTTGAGTTNLTRAVLDSFTAPPARFVLGDIVDLDFVPGTNVSYVVSRAADAVQRVVWNEAGVTLGSTATRQIDVIGNATIGQCQAPTGIAVNTSASRAYLNCWVSRRLGVIDLTAQALAKTVVASDAPTMSPEQSVQRGKRFYNTGRGRWSNAGANGTVGGEGWSSCASCHPDGLTDDITWSFAAGPRQTVSQDGSFSHGADPQKQRVFNHTGIFDEHHDFEGNTRGVSGGLGAITTAAMAADCNNLTLEMRVALTTDPVPGPLALGLGKPAKEIADDPAIALCQHKDWDDIDNFVRTIRPPRRLRSLDAASVANGRALFQAGECAKCHGGPGWTLSRRFYTPSEAENANLAATDFVRPAAWPVTWSYLDGANPRKHISVQPVIATDATGPGEAATIAPPEVACVLRNVGTFGVPGDTAATDALEVKATGARAQGRGGYNIPSLYGLALGRPYLHHGQAKTLEDLFTQPAYSFHTDAGNANFSVTLDANDVADLINFLLSIDAEQSEIAPPAGFDGCP